ncbi:high nitrogen upregulated cytochrome P450 monooxygenase 2 [Daedaleopsis nitida]|nr:high nitrogen upregulated cytochrome P450 monooxygenase 2 [Daedaleopsis nitida]
MGFDLAHLAVLVVPVAAASHHVLRRYETNFIPLHAALLLGPPAILAAFLRTSSQGASEKPSYTLLLAIHLVTVVSLVVGYRLSSLHPLSRYPGPLASRISMLIPAWNSIAGHQMRYNDALHAEYGYVVRTGPNQLSIADPALVPALLGPSGVPKGPYFTGGSMSETDVPMVGIQDTESHLLRRRAWNRGLSRSAVREYEQAILSRARLLVQRLEEQRGEVILGKWLSHFSYDFIFDVAFGGGSELMRDGDRNNVWSIIEGGMVAAKFLSQVPWLGIYVGYIPGAAGPLNKLMEGGRQLAAKRLARGSTTHDLFHYLNNEDLADSEPPPPSQLVNDGVLAVNAGSDSTSVALTSIFFCILVNTNVYATLQEEIDRLYGPEEDPCSTKHHREMQYLQAVINEALRLYPPGPGGTQRRVPLRGSAVTIGSLYLPPGTAFYVPPFTMHRDKRNFTFPKTFWPERWLIASGKLKYESAPLPVGIDDHDRDTTAFVHNEGAFIPFSYGPMNCPGKSLAMIEMQTVVCALLHQFRMQLAQGWDTTSFDRGYKDYFTATRPELPVTLQPRRR